MKWALKAITNNYTFIVYNDKTSQFDTVTAPINSIVNFIVYDGVSEYNPGSDLALVQVPDNAVIGDIV